MSASPALLGSLPRVIIPKRLADDRGWFSETFSEQRLREVGITCYFVQDNQSTSRRAGTLRGFHFQVPPVAQAKLISVLRGRILDVAIDVRSGSPTLLKHVWTSHRALTVNGGLADHRLFGFLTISRNASPRFRSCAVASSIIAKSSSRHRMAIRLPIPMGRNSTTPEVGGNRKRLSVARDAPFKEAWQAH
jgi:dTDP-4-dehydrorhamnose 3,5-epimerase